MRAVMIGIALFGGVLVSEASVAVAQSPTPGGGPSFGQHVSGMAPEHPMDHGAMFGECLSMMARGEGCPHHGE